MKKFYVRCYIDNAGGAYDPAPVYDLDIEECVSAPVIGDVLYTGEQVGEYYRVLERHFDLDSNRCALIVEQIEPIRPFSKGL